MNALPVKILICCLVLVNGQNLCSYTPPTTSNSSRLFINNFSTNKCLRVERFGHFPDSKIFIDECSWWTSATRDQLFTSTASKTTSDGVVLTTNAGLDQHYCVSTKDGTLKTSHCREGSFDSLWKFKPVRNQPNQVLIQQVSSLKCLMPKDRKTRSIIQLVPCNSFQTEQIWKLCFYNSTDPAIL